MGLDLNTTERGVTICATDNAGTAITIELTPWEAVCLAEDLRGRSQAHAMSGNVGTHRVTRSAAPSSGYRPDLDPFTETETARMMGVV